MRVLLAAALLVVMSGYMTGSRGAETLPVSSVSTPKPLRAAALAAPWGAAVRSAHTDATVQDAATAAARAGQEAVAVPVLRGILQQGERRLALWKTAGETSVTACGENVGGWTVVAIASAQVTLVRGTAVVTVPLTEEA